jgi:hypothetical protein
MSLAVNDAESTNRPRNEHHRLAQISSEGKGSQVKR